MTHVVNLHFVFLGFQMQLFFFHCFLPLLFVSWFPLTSTSPVEQPVGYQIFIITLFLTFPFCEKLAILQIVLHQR